MRFAAFALIGLAACSLTPSGSDCSTDTQCGDDVCSRSGECLARSSIREVTTVRWTVNGNAADSISCAAHPDLYIQFDGVDYGDTLRMAPVACRAGSYSVAKLPRRYTQVELGIDGSTGDVAVIDRITGTAQLDLFQ